MALGKARVRNLLFTLVGVGFILSSMRSEGEALECEKSSLALCGEIKRGLTRTEIENLLKSRDVGFKYVSPEELNKIVDVTPSTQKRGGEYWIRLDKKDGEVKIVYEIDMVTVRLDYLSERVVSVECKPVLIGP